MKPKNIATASVLPRLREILLEDIINIEQLSSKVKNDEGLLSMLDSIKSAKENILVDIPGNVVDVNQGSPNSPQKGHLSGYKNTDLSDADSNFKLVKQIYEAESSQAELVMSAMSGKGIPVGLESILTGIYRKYSKISDQLGRMVKTQQLGTINIG